MKEIVDPSKEATKKSLAGNTAFDEESSDNTDSWHLALQRHIDGSGQVEVEILSCDINKESNSESMNISLVTPTGKTFAVKANISATIGSLKRTIYEKEGIPHGDQRINFGGKMLEDDKTLFDYKIHDNAKLTLVLRCRGGGAEISVMKKRLTCEVEFIDTVDGLKKEIHECVGIPMAQQRLTYAGKQLEDGHSLIDYGIQSGATLDIVITLCRGDMVIELAEIKLATKNFHRDYLIAEGGSAKVYCGSLHGKSVAIKRLKPESDESEPYKTKKFWTEVAALGVCDHPYIMKMIGYYQDEKERIIVLEYVAGGSLFSRLHARRADDAILDWSERLQIALDIASAIAYLHTEVYLIHRDLKTDNVLLDADLRAKVADFGIVKSRPHDDGEVHTKLQGTLGYLCPHYYKTESVGPYSDVYAFGVILLELITGRKALDTTTHTLLADWARRFIMDVGHHDLRAFLDPCLVGKIEDSVLKDVANLATKCVALEKNDRPSMTYIHSKLLSMKLGWKN